MSFPLQIYIHIILYGLNGLPLAKKNDKLSNPVFATFTANTSDKKVMLNWGTAIETSGTFEVSRSVTGGDNWTNIGTMSTNGKMDFSFSDESLSDEGKYSYRIKYIGKDGGYAYSEITDVEILPVTFKLEQNYPNPFNPTTTIQYQLPQNSTVKAVIYNAIGEQVDELVNGVQQAGSYKYVWNAARFASGVYLLSLQASGTNGEHFNKVIKLMLVK